MPSHRAIWMKRHDPCRRSSESPERPRCGTGADESLIATASAGSADFDFSPRWCSAAIARCRASMFVLNRTVSTSCGMGSRRATFSSAAPRPPGRTGPVQQTSFECQADLLAVTRADAQGTDSLEPQPRFARTGRDQQFGNGRLRDRAEIRQPGRRLLSRLTGRGQGGGAGSAQPVRSRRPRASASARLHRRPDMAVLRRLLERLRGTLRPRPQPAQGTSGQPAALGQVRVEMLREIGDDVRADSLQSRQNLVLMPIACVEEDAKSSCPPRRARSCGWPERRRWRGGEVGLAQTSIASDGDLLGPVQKDRVANFQIAHVWQPFEIEQQLQQRRRRRTGLAPIEPAPGPPPGVSAGRSRPRSPQSVHRRQALPSPHSAQESIQSRPADPPRAVFHEGLQS